MPKIPKMFFCSPFAPIRPPTSLCNTYADLGPRRSRNELYWHVFLRWIGPHITTITTYKHAAAHAPPPRGTPKPSALPRGHPTQSRCERSRTQSPMWCGAMASRVRTLPHHTGAAAHGSRCCAAQNHSANRRAGFRKFRVAAASQAHEAVSRAGVRVPQGAAEKRNHIPAPLRTSPPPLRSPPNRPLLYDTYG